MSKDGTVGVGSLFRGDVTLPTLSEKDSCIFVQPNQEVMESIHKLSKQSTPETLITLLNPQWHNGDDALHSASKTGGIVGNLVTFLGGMGSVLKQPDEMGYVPTYTLEVRLQSGNVRLLKRFDSDWMVFAEKDKMCGDFTSSYVQLSSIVIRSRIRSSY